LLDSLGSTDEPIQPRNGGNGFARAADNVDWNQQGFARRDRKRKRA
jgi:hypothetical protein